MILKPLNICKSLGLDKNCHLCKGIECHYCKRKICSRFGINPNQIYLSCKKCWKKHREEMEEETQRLLNLIKQNNNHGNKKENTTGRV